MKRPIFEITPIEEDPILIDVARKLKVNDATLSKVVNKYGLGYHRDGAGHYTYLTKEDITFLTKYFVLKRKQNKQWESFLKSHLQNDTRHSFDGKVLPLVSSQQPVAYGSR